MKSWYYEEIELSKIVVAWLKLMLKILQQFKSVIFIYCFGLFQNSHLHFESSLVLLHLMKLKYRRIYSLGARLVQSLNSPFRAPYIGIEPWRAKRTLRAPGFNPYVGRAGGGVQRLDWGALGTRGGGGGWTSLFCHSTIF